MLVFLHSLSVGTLVWIGWTVSLAVQKPSIGAFWRPQTGVVYFIDDGHPSADEFRVGDRIVNLEGFSPTYLNILSDWNGQSIHVLVNRYGTDQEITAQVKPSGLGQILDRLPSFFVGLAFWLAGSYVLAFSRSRRQAILFFLMCQSAVISLTSGAVSSYSPEWVKIGFHSGLLCLGAMAVLLHLVFPTKVELKRRAQIGYGLILMTAFLSLLYAVEVISGKELIPTPITWIATIALFCLDLVIVIVALFSSYRKSRTALERNQVGIIALSAAIGIFPVITIILVPQLILGYPLLSINLAFLALLTLPIGYGFAIYRYRLIGVKETINRGLALVLVGLILMGFYSLCYTISTRFISPTITQSPVWGLGTTVLLAGLTTRMYGALTRFMNNILYGGWYDFRTVVAQTKNSLAASDTNRETIGATLCEVIGQSMRLETVQLLFPDGIRSRYVYRKPVEMDLLPENQCADFFIAIAVTGDGQDDLVPWNHDLAASYRMIDPTPSVLPKLLAPMRGKDGSLLGVFFVGEKRDSEPFNETDTEILNVVLHQARSSLENVRLIQETQARAKKITDLHRKVLQTRDEERKEIAQDLHDLVIQSLVGANYQLADLRRKYEDTQDETLLKVQDEVRESIRVLRQICEDLRPPLLDVADFFDVLRQRIAEIEESSNFIVRVSIEGNEQQELSDDVKMCIYRMVQESLINIHKHARADHVEVFVEITSEQVLVMVTDNGIGFEAPENIEHLRLENHQGLVGIKERIDAVNGTLTIQSSPGQGCVMAAQVPI
jgi:signal transduction histidine kinase